MSDTTTNDEWDPPVRITATVWNAALRAAFARGAEAMKAKVRLWLESRDMNDSADWLKLMDLPGYRDA